MAYRVVLTDKAEADVESVLKWFCDQRATDAGGRWYGQLIAKLDTLENHPERCALAAESEDVGQEIRELLLGRRRYKYRILFKISGGRSRPRSSHGCWQRPKRVRPWKRSPARTAPCCTCSRRGRACGGTSWAA